MRITTKGRYALRASITLARLGKNGEMISISNLSEAEDISPILLEQIFFKLKKAGLVKSVRGPGGGFAFNRPLDGITVREILDAAGEELTVFPCDRQEPICPREGHCTAHNVFLGVTKAANDYLESLTLKMVLENPEFNEVH